MKDTSVQTAIVPATQQHISTVSRPIRRIAASILASVGLVFGAVLASTAPAQAATGYSTLTGCFQSSYTAGGTTYWGKYTGTAYVDAYYNGAWRQVTTSSLSLYTGCTSISVSAGYHWRLRVNEYRRPYRFVGTSNYTNVVIGGGYTYNVGTTRLGTIYVG